MKSKIGNLLILSGLLLIAAAICIAGYNIWETHQAEQSTQEMVQLLKPYISQVESSVQNEINLPEAENSETQSFAPTISIPEYIRFPEMEMPVQEIDGWECVGIVVIPSLERELPVISSWSYPALKAAPCRYRGSAYTNDLILMAHNYPSHFGNLKQLSIGDSVIFTDMDGNVFAYEVVLKETLEPTAIEEMQSGDWDLTLFTCTLGGSYRVTVRCERAADQSCYDIG